MIPVSVVIITFNEERNITRCIDSVISIADEIIVLDSFSTDATVSIAESKGAIIHKQAFAGYISQKNMALSLARYDFVLSLDADEALDAKLQSSILEVKKNPRFKAYTMNRCPCYMGKFIRHGLWYPDRKLRLFDRNMATWGGIDPHDIVQLKKSIPIHHLKGDILHYPFISIEEHVAQNSRYSSISAEFLYHRGKKTSWFKLFVNPAWAFFNGYILRLGFLDGFYGYLIARNDAQLTFLKHAKLFQKQKEDRARRIAKGKDS